MIRIDNKSKNIDFKIKESFLKRNFINQKNIFKGSAYVMEQLKHFQIEIFVALFPVLSLCKLKIGKKQIR
jgi:hypothetical protein